MGKLIRKRERSDITTRGATATLSAETSKPTETEPGTGNLTSENAKPTKKLPLSEIFKTFKIKIISKEGNNSVPLEAIKNFKFNFGTKQLAEKPNSDGLKNFKFSFGPQTEAKKPITVADKEISKGSQVNATDTSEKPKEAVKNFSFNPEKFSSLHEQHRHGKSKLSERFITKDTREKDKKNAEDEKYEDFKIERNVLDSTNDTQAQAHLFLRYIEDDYKIPDEEMEYAKYLHNEAEDDPDLYFMIKGVDQFELVEDKETGEIMLLSADKVYGKPDRKRRGSRSELDPDEILNYDDYSSSDESSSESEDEHISMPDLDELEERSVDEEHSKKTSKNREMESGEISESQDTEAFDSSKLRKISQKDIEKRRQELLNAIEKNMESYKKELAIKREIEDETQDESSLLRQKLLKKMEKELRLLGKKKKEEKPKVSKKRKSDSKKGSSKHDKKSSKDKKKGKEKIKDKKDKRQEKDKFKKKEKSKHEKSDRKRRKSHDEDDDKAAKRRRSSREKNRPGVSTYTSMTSNSDIWRSNIKREVEDDYRRSDDYRRTENYRRSDDHKRAGSDRRVKNEIDEVEKGPGLNKNVAKSLIRNALFDPKTDEGSSDQKPPPSLAEAMLKARALINESQVPVRSFSTLYQKKYDKKRKELMQELEKKMEKFTKKIKEGPSKPKKIKVEPTEPTQTEEKTKEQPLSLAEAMLKARALTAKKVDETEEGAAKETEEQVAKKVEEPAGTPTYETAEANDATKETTQEGEKPTKAEANKENAVNEAPKEFELSVEERIQRHREKLLKKMEEKLKRYKDKLRKKWLSEETMRVNNKSSREGDRRRSSRSPHRNGRSRSRDRMYNRSRSRDHYRGRSPSYSDYYDRDRYCSHQNRLRSAFFGGRREFHYEYDEERDKQRRRHWSIMRCKSPSPDSIRRYYCEACHIRCYGPKQYEQHIESERHKEKEAGIQKMVMNRTSFKCEICNIVCQGIQSWTMHKEGKAHKRSVFLLGRMRKNVCEDPTVISKDNKEYVLKDGKLIRKEELQKMEDLDKELEGEKAKKVEVPQTAFLPGGELTNQEKEEGEISTDPKLNVQVKTEIPDEQEAGTSTDVKPLNTFQPNMPVVGEEFIETVTDPNGQFLHYACKICDCYFTDINARDIHLAGRRHRYNYQIKVDPSARPELQPFMGGGFPRPAYRMKNSTLWGPPASHFPPNLFMPWGEPRRFFSKRRFISLEQTPHAGHLLMNANLVPLGHRPPVLSFEMEQRPPFGMEPMVRLPWNGPFPNPMMQGPGPSQPMGTVGGGELEEGVEYEEVEVEVEVDEHGNEIVREGNNV